MSSRRDVLCPRRPLLRGPPLAGVLLQGQAVPERVGSGDPGRAGRCGGDRPGAGLPAGPTGRHHFRPELVYSFIHSFIHLLICIIWPDVGANCAHFDIKQQPERKNHKSKTE